MRTALQVGILLACILPAQEGEKPVLQNADKPMVVDFHCTADDIRWGGLTCSDEEPCPMYLELSALESVGNRIFAAGNIHSDSSTLYSILLASDDSGKTWREAHERVRGATLDQMQFIDFEAGWVAGQIVYPLPRDPFFLITSDGGKTFRNRPVFSESRPGSLLQFRFTSRSEGSLVFDRGQGGDMGRYELYESPNGGETWMLRETNERRMNIKRAAGAAPDWRIRVDAAMKAYVLERRQSERWTPLAAFAVSIGACKPPSPPPVEETEAPAGTVSDPAPQPPPG